MIVISATNRGAKRNENDFYATPEWCVTGLMDKLILTPHNTKTCLEPCRGDGAIEDIIMFQFEDIEWCELTQGRDFLTYNFEGRTFDFCITNPPYSLAEEFIRRSIELADCTVMLLRLNFLGGQKRHDVFWSLEKYKPTGIIICGDRPSFTGHGTDATEYAWFIWDKTGEQMTGLDWIRDKNKKKRGKKK